MDPTAYETQEEEYADWCEERHAFLCDGHEDDLMSPFACGWCGEMVGTNGAQANSIGGTVPNGGNNGGNVPIYLDSSGTAWHTLCAFEREGILQ